MEPPAGGSETLQYHVDGELVARTEATLPIDDRGVRLGDAATEPMRAYGGEVFGWAARERRLRTSCDALGMVGAVPDDLALRVAETLDANDLADALVRVVVTRGTGAGLTPPADPDPTVVVTVEPLPRGGLPGNGGERTWPDPAVVQSVTARRVPDAAVPGEAHTTSAVARVLARVELQRVTREDYRPDEALVRDTEGAVVGGAASDLFFVVDGTLRVPDVPAPAAGHTRAVVLDLAADEAFPVESVRATPADVREADEAFLTNARWELRPVGTLDGIDVGDGPITRLLRRLYDERVERRCY